MSDTFYNGTIAVFAVFAFGLARRQITGFFSNDSTSTLTRFRHSYVLVYSLEMLGDWLLGPYVYALYSHYGYGVGDIGKLFIAGFGSSLLFGTVVGALGDKYGRRRAGLTYVTLYSLSCATKHSPQFHVLLLGRLLGGISTSLLFSAFESWLVAEHTKRGFSETALGDTFSLAVFFGNGVMAIVAGLLGNFLAKDMGLGFVAPFDAAAVSMLIGGGIMLAFWSENYGDKNVSGLGEQFGKAWQAIRSDARIALLGAMQAMFEASMYTFVFLWTPALSPNKESIPHGKIFAAFMTASMAGSASLDYLLKVSAPESYMRWVFGASAAALFVPFCFHLGALPLAAGSREGDPISWQGKVQIVAFCLFELGVGVFWPSMMKMRATYIPDETRATIINIFRMPLNLFVCLALYYVEFFSLSFMFGLCVLLLLASMVCQVRMLSLVDTESKERSEERQALKSQDSDV